jgi:hypothetical protein
MHPSYLKAVVESDAGVQDLHMNETTLRNSPWDRAIPEVQITTGLRGNSNRCATYLGRISGNAEFWNSAVNAAAARHLITPGRAFTPSISFQLITCILSRATAKDMRPHLFMVTDSPPSRFLQGKPCLCFLRHVKGMIVG